MDKWNYITLISKKDMLLQLMDWAGAMNTQQVTQEQAEEFYKLFVEDK